MSPASARRLARRVMVAAALAVVPLATVTLTLAGGGATAGHDERQANVLAYYQGKAP